MYPSSFTEKARRRCEVVAAAVVGRRCLLLLVDQDVKRRLYLPIENMTFSFSQRKRTKDAATPIESYSVVVIMKEKVRKGRQNSDEMMDDR